MSDYAIAIAAPFPAPDQLTEGWMRRVDSIDQELQGIRRIYLSFSEAHDDESVCVIWHDPERGEACIHPTGKRSIALVSEIIDEVNFVYIHTLHYAEFLLPWLKCKQICVDIHGITPEEEVMLGRPNLKAHYENIERQVLKHALRCIAVSDAMVEHYREKYPDISPRWLTIPVFGNCLDLMVLSERMAEGGFHSPYRVIYSGGVQTWQNINAMLALARHCGDGAAFAFYSRDHEVLEKQAEALSINATVEFGYKTMEQLKDVYASADFGLILRDDSPVNRVCCPTKLAEYVQFGLIPIVRSPRLGDFHTHGFGYVTEEQFRAGEVPNAASRNQIIRQNGRVVQKLGNRFSGGVAQLRELIFHIAEHIGEPPGALLKGAGGQYTKCLPWMLGSSDKAYEKKRVPMTIQTIRTATIVKGTVHAQGPVVDQDSGLRMSDICVSLPPGVYSQSPMLFVALGAVDLQQGSNSRLEVSILENTVTKDEFCVRFRTWADTKVWSAYANWMAIGNASDEE